MTKKLLLLLCALPGLALADEIPDDEPAGAGELRTIPVEPIREAPALQAKVEGVDIRLGGFAKLDVLYSRFSDGDVPSLDAGRDYFRPNSIPVAGAGTVEDGRDFTDMHAKDTRLFLDADARVAGHEVGAYVEIDFRSAVGGATEVSSNSYNPRMRRAFLTYDKWLFGQEWTLFRNLDAHPDQIDDLRGPVQALSIVRQPQVRYSTGSFQVALENAETNVLPRAGTATATFVTGDSRLPDLTARYTLKGDYGAVAITGLVRQLHAERAPTGGAAPDDDVDGSAVGYGLNVSGKLPFQSGDDFRFGLSAGTGIGRYIGLATSADAVVDAGGGLEPIALTAAYGAYRHLWNAFWRSTATLATYAADNDAALTGDAVTKSVHSGHVNALYSPVDKVTFGVELMHAIRELESGQDGTLTRVQFSAKYEF